MKIWVTRDETREGQLCRALEAVGLTPVLEPVVQRRMVSDAADALAKLGENDWLVLTSPYAAQCIAINRLAGGLARPCEDRSSLRPKIAVVGTATAAAARSAQLHVDLVSNAFTAASLFAQLQREVHEGTICYPRSSLAAPPQSWANVTIVSPIVYETSPRAFDRSIIERVDAAAITSASAATSIGCVPLRFASIGPTTSAAIRQTGASVWLEAPQPTFESLADAIAAH